jgi:predicted nucleic acid-binding protein
MASRVYLETTVISYLTAWPSSDLIRSAHQQLTKDWWQNCLDRFDVFVSQAVMEEAARGDPDAAAERLEAIASFPLLQTTADVEALARILGKELRLPDRATTDALHIAISAVHGMEYLLTWNCRHIANATLRPSIERLCHDAGYAPPLICTPEELI